MAQPGVLIVAERALPDRGGLAVATSRIAAQAAARGERVWVLAFSKEQSPGTRGRIERDGVTYLPVGRLPLGDEAMAAMLLHAQDVLAAEGLDLVHGIYATHAGYLATLLGRLSSVASVVSLRGNDIDRGIFRHQDLTFVAEAVRHATVVTAVSRALGDTASKLFGREVTHITNSVDGDVFSPQPKDPVLAASLGLAGRTVIGFLGELREKKGMRFLLPAFAQLSRERDARLLLIGGLRHDAVEAFEAFARAMPDVYARIHVAPYQRNATELSKLLSFCDVMVFPSLFEGTPNAVLEAMAVGRPILATAVGGHLDILEHGVSGALLPLSQLDQLPEAIEEMLDLPDDVRREFGAHARLRVLARHTADIESDAYAQEYSRARSLVR